MQRHSIRLIGHSGPQLEPATVEGTTSVKPALCHGQNTRGFDLCYRSLQMAHCEGATVHGV